MIVAIIWLLPSPPLWLVLTSLAYPIYYFGLSFVLHGTRSSRARLQSGHQWPN
jgi:hypothetical protein